MNTKNWLAVAALLLSTAVGASPLDQAAQWLDQQRNANGYANPAPVVSDELASLRAVSALGVSERIDGAIAASMLNAEYYTLDAMTTQELAHAWLASYFLGQPTETWRKAVLSRQVAGGGFAKYLGGSADLHATMTVLEALLDQRGVHASAFNGAFGWLVDQQHADGAWYAGQPLKPSSFITARAAHFLYALRHDYELSAQLSLSRQALVQLREGDALWGEPHASAAALRFLLVDAPGDAETDAATQAFVDLQQPDGSYSGDTFATAWALLALHQADQPPPPSGRLSELRGQVISADTGGPMATVGVTLTSSTGVRQTATNINGHFEVDELDAGSYTLSLSYPDHDPFEAELTVPFNQVYDVGQIQLFMGGGSETLVVRGLVSDAESGEPIVGATVQGGGVAATTNDEGRYQLLSVPPGDLELRAKAEGYYASSADAFGEAGMVVDFSPTLAPGAGHHTGAILRGVVGAEDTGQPLDGAVIEVAGANQASLQSQVGGEYETVLPQPGPVQIVVSAPGYHSAEWNTMVTAGGLIDYSPFLRPDDGPTPEGAGLRGRVVSAANGEGIDGADLHITNGDEVRFGRADDAGEFSFNELAFDSAVLEIEATGFHPLRLSVAVPPLDVRELGDIPLRPIRMQAYLPDLVVADIDLTVTDTDSFELTQAVEVTVANRGTASTNKSFSLKAFIDAADNDEFDPEVDVVVGSARIAGGLTVGEEKAAVISLEGQVGFRDAPVKVWIDSEQEVMQLNFEHPVVSTAEGCRIDPAPLSSDGIRERWNWSEYSGDERIANVATTPLVVQLTDDNDDGVIDQHDIPDIVFVAGDMRNDTNPSQTRLVALSGDDGRELWAVDHDLSHYTQLAAADINKDGYINIVGVTRTRSHLVAVNHDGSLLWKQPLDGPSRPRPIIPPWAWAGDYVSITNLEGDAEAHIVYGRRVFRGIDGSMLWEGDRDHGGHLGGHAGENPIPIGDGLSSFAADINLDGDKQILAGRTLYDRLGNVIWHRDDLGSEFCDWDGHCISTSGMVAVGNFDEDDYAEIVMVIDGTLRVLNHDGTDLWGPIDLPDNDAGDVAIADLTRDGQPEIVVSQNTVLQVYRYNGDLLWTAPIEDPSGWVSVSIADINGNGWLEILHMDEVNFRLLDGATGVEYFRIRNTSITISEYPVIADVTGDGQANFVVPGNNRTDFPAGTPGIRVYEADNGRWAAARGLWNQHHYSINHIEDDGAVPLTEKPSWLTHNTFRAAYQGENPSALPDITLGRVRLIDDGVNISLEARIGSGGLVNPHDHPRLELFDGDPAAGGERLVMQQLIGLDPGSFVDIRVDDLPLELDSGELHVWINRDQAANECRDNNNHAVLPWQAIAPSGQIELELEPDEVLRGEPLDLPTTVSNQGRLPAEFSVHWRHVDAQGQFISEIGRQTLPVLAPQEALTVEPDWLPLSLIEGVHRVEAVLLGPDGQPVDLTQADFEILAVDGDLPMAGLTILPDKSAYRRDDTVRVQLNAQNRHSAISINQARIELQVTAPNNDVVHAASIPLGNISGGQQVQRHHSLELSEGEIGDYRIEATLISGQNPSPLATAGTGFEVLDQIAISGQVTVGWLEGQPYCTDTVRNQSLSGVQQLPVQARLVHFDTESDADLRQYHLDLAPAESRLTQRHFDGELEAGEYLCVLEAWQDQHWQVLGTAAFELAGAPPTVLMWLEGPDEVSEDGSQTTLALALGTLPAAPVTVSVSHDRPDEIELDLDELQFDADNWDQAQLVTITGLPDDIRDGDQTIWLHAQAASADLAYDGLEAEPLSIINRDIDQPGIEVSPTSLPEFDEDQPTATITVRMLNRPFDPVSLPLSLSDDIDFAISPQVLEFSPDDWEDERTVQIQLQPEEREQAITAWLEFGPASSADEGYDGMEVPAIELQAAPQGGPGVGPPPIPVPLSPWAAWFLIVLLLLTACRKRRLRHV
ncbi:carboxypeptidase regulatory-like domain-containing protein [Wenzhouxiangella sp. AB-CW3]|uniref:carboxypeptidase regulatory-like domain-containing protein n=1 Tax=Wenzhouxiangella sp. AB-CW3 TaxID=2771012 RepID=UPI00168A9E59|nr:carboxypeptidase regulatory-like domain-containing protein [Wenzhouxiangella sp. AB-CW3]QOC23491.1 carboxypeptidase regulatory-like domain-containing protein [Wenzhouxiangella sp. AB-CW3]